MRMSFKKFVLTSSVIIATVIITFVLKTRSGYDYAMSNQLSKESSPYLLQHKDNPVNWYAYNDDAFELAKKLDRPIFLSIGYSTCHWCHVMEHESFEDTEVAKLMNDTFVNIKVDREERPDVDHLYMSICQMLTGSGGWPLTIIMTPDKRPFFAGTYFPKSSQANRPGMLDLIPSIDDAWTNKREEVLQSAQKIVAGIVQYGQNITPTATSTTLFEDTFTQFSTQFDTTYKGLKNSPKFPMPHTYMFLIDYYKKTGEKQALTMLNETLHAMYFSGLYDHLGKGFHRYSTDEKWHLPHFEKMLYDQALLLSLYSRAYQLEQNETYKEIIQEIIDYVSTDLRHAKGGFFSAEDADSEGREGAFYVWEMHELEELLTQDELKLATQFYALKKEGNFLDESTRQLTGENILDPVQSFSQFAKQNNLEINAFKTELAKLQQKLLTHRKTRVRPGLDDKILVDWNGLMIAGLADAYKFSSNQQAKDLAINAYTFIKKYGFVENKLIHRIKDETAGIAATSFDYQFLCYGLIKLFEATADETYLIDALNLFNTSKELFFDDKAGAFVISNADDLIYHQKDSYDGAIPASNSVAYFNALKLSQYTHNAELFIVAKKLADFVSESLNNYPLGYTFWLQGSYLLESSLPTLVSTLKITNSQRNQLIKLNPNLVIQDLTETPKLAKLITQNGFQTDIKGYYYCTDFTCLAPTSDFEQLINQIK
jgi:uncharacterized protein